MGDQIWKSSKLSGCLVVLGLHVLKVALRKFFKIGNYISIEPFFSLKSTFFSSNKVFNPQYSPQNEWKSQNNFAIVTYVRDLKKM
jgi:hypothetical protein